VSHDVGVRLTADEHGVALLAFCQPQRRNPLDRATIDAFVAALERFGADDALRALVITGEGSAFCAGGDLDEIATMSETGSREQRDYLWRHIQRIPRAFARLDKPVIAAVNGAAHGAGFDIALMCDIRLAARSASFSESYIRLGLIAGDGGMFFLTQVLGAARSLELLWTGRTVAAEEALRLGIVSELCEDGELRQHALALAARIAAQPLEPVRMTKRAVQSLLAAKLDPHLDMIASHMAVLYDSEAFRERIAGLQQARRKP
jgi:enoyl-CoA hydratase/carnithine racemase